MQIESIGNVGDDGLMGFLWGGWGWVGVGFPSGVVRTCAFSGLDSTMRSKIIITSSTWAV